MFWCSMLVVEVMCCGNEFRYEVGVWLRCMRFVLLGMFGIVIDGEGFVI